MSFTKLLIGCLLILTTFSGWKAWGSEEDAKSMETIPVTFAYLPEECPEDCCIHDSDLYRIFCLGARGVEKPVTRSIAAKLNKRGRYPILTRTHTSTAAFGICIMLGALAWLPNFTLQAVFGCTLPSSEDVDGRAMISHEALLNYTSCSAAANSRYLATAGAATACSVVFAILGQRLYDSISRHTEHLANRYQDGTHELQVLYAHMAKALLGTYIRAHWKVKLMPKPYRLESELDQVDHEQLDPRYLDETKSNVFADPLATLVLVKKVLSDLPSLVKSLEKVSEADGYTLRRIVNPLEQLHRIINRGDEFERSLLSFVLWEDRSLETLDKIFLVLTDEDLKAIIISSPAFKG